MGELRAHPFMPKRDAILQQLVRMLSMSPEVIQSDLRAACNARRQTVRIAVAEMVDLSNMNAVMLAVMSVSGMVNKDDPSGEAKAATL